MRLRPHINNFKRDTFLSLGKCPFLDVTAKITPHPLVMNFGYTSTKLVHYPLSTNNV